MGLIGALLGIVARFWPVWLIIGFFMPPFFVLAILGSVIYMASAAYEPPRPRVPLRDRPTIKR